MNLSSITPEAVFAGKMAQTGSEFSMLATKRAIETMQTEGQMIVQLVEQAGGVGRNFSATA
jgi:hypothetical protein